MHKNPKRSTAPVVFADLPPGLPGTAPFAAVGDPQGTLFLERVLLLRESNPIERGLVLAELTRRRPEFLIVAGDLTSYGWAAKGWRQFEHVTEAMRGMGMPILPILGNHDYGAFRATASRNSVAKSRSREFGTLRASALRNFEARFPFLAGSRWYTRVYGHLALVFLDTNVSVLSAPEWRRQEEWYARTLGAYDADPAIGGVVVLAHQAPFTNSTVTRDDVAVQAAFVPPFLRSPKGVAMISGHTHSYEHFVKEGKHFIVTGGGGGPRVRLHEGAAERHPDLFRGPSPRPFHYLWISPQPHGLAVAVEGLNKGETAFATIDRFDLIY